VNVYTLYNVVWGLCVLVGSCWLLRDAPDRRRDVGRGARVALIMTLLGYPWDFFAIQRGVWAYPRDPGWRLHGVPLNDLVFMWLCTYFACCVLVTHARRHARGEGDPEREHAGHHDPRHDGHRTAGRQP
jgi:lycopene cyclase domain-containing protein